MGIENGVRSKELRHSTGSDMHAVDVTLFDCTKCANKIDQNLMRVATASRVTGVVMCIYNMNLPLVHIQFLHLIPIWTTQPPDPNFPFYPMHINPLPLLSPGLTL